MLVQFVAQAVRWLKLPQSLNARISPIMTGPRYICMAMLSEAPAAADSVNASIEHHDLFHQLGAGRVPRANWHQSLSDRYWEGATPDLETKLTRACSLVTAQAVTLKLNRIVRGDGYCALHADGTPAFRALLLAVKAALATQGIASPASNQSQAYKDLQPRISGDQLGLF
jgi:ethanolamine ammonia-lyase small subunit